MILELLLTIVAWRKGWGPIALLPFAVGVTLGVLASSVSNSILPAVLADMLIYGVLIAMIVAGRKKTGAVPARAAAVASMESRTAA